MKRMLPIIIVFCNLILLTGCHMVQSSESVAYENVDSVIAEADDAFENEEYEEALTIYADALKRNSVDMNAQLGAAKCQIALGNYAVAAINLAAAAKIDPTEAELYELYMQLSEESDSLSYARTAVSLAVTNQVESFLSRVPDAPVFSYADGNYDTRLEVEISAEEGAEIYIIEIKDSISYSYQYNDTPVTVTKGTTQLQAYCLKDGIPSETAEANYVCDYEPTEVIFTDSVIEQIVRATLNIPEGKITDVDCESITALNQSILLSNGMSSAEYSKLRIASLEDLQFMLNLQSVYLYYLDELTDYSPLETCRKLHYLYLYEGNLSDISFVSSLSNLWYFRIADQNVSDLSPLAACEDLYYLSVEGNPLTDLGALQDLDLMYMTFDASQMSDATLLLNWPDLYYLAIYGSGNFDLSVLGCLTDLSSLYLYGSDYTTGESSAITDLDFLKNMTALERLYINCLQDYSQMEMVTELQNLTYLYFKTLDYTSPSDELIQKLQSSLPGCSIYY